MSTCVERHCVSLIDISAQGEKKRLPLFHVCHGTVSQVIICIFEQTIFFDNL